MSTPSRLAINTLARSMGVQSKRSIHSTAMAGRSIALGTESRHVGSKEGLGYLAPRAEAPSSTRAFSNVLVPKAPVTPAPSTHAFSTGNIRTAAHLNLPNIAEYSPSPERPAIQIPFLPDNFNPYRKPEPEPVVAKPIIYTVAENSSHIAVPSALPEFIDNSSITFAFHEFKREVPTVSKLPDEHSIGAIFKDVLGEPNLKVLV